MSREIEKISLALSGGGVRAATFHAGLLRYLAEKGKLEQVTNLSTVSGGSLLIGLMYSLNKYKFPTSKDYLDRISIELKTTLTSKSLQKTALMRLFFTIQNWIHFFSRAFILADALEKCWGIKGKLKDIPSIPVWSINATTAETGKRFRFKGHMMGEYTLGYADASNFPLSHAMAVSAAFPGGIGPLELRKNSFYWQKRNSWDSSEEDVTITSNETINLYDGGVYDNLGIEPLFDCGRQELKLQGNEPIDFLIVSDAGLPLEKTSIPGFLNPLRFYRLFNLALDQTRSLRVRSFMNFINRTQRGAYVYIGSYSMNENEEGYSILTNKSRMKVAFYPTSLSQMKVIEFTEIEMQGYETAKAILKL
ncbi:NTE family protein [Leptospira meyeri]|uniref:NTE family protein n=1 Tax=Leptospira meyeri TaxID=29508 RepID=A0A4R8MIV1_LEPME|nr:patatin-like phospholipase family protein [Leptospira meyeri]EKJ86176.1 phospholipase, patatin family [Leptospira meyeri serovar Hardjo str. Went 5]TDY66541.1 NTE family protein [Leptospira meyeri]